MAEGGNKKHRKHRRQDNDPLTSLSKSLSWLLRHGSNSVGLTLLPGGFLYVSDVMKLPQFSKFTVEDVQKVVDNNEKQRFFLVTDPDNGQLKIRANQGHSVQVDDLDLTPITDGAQFDTVIHGTNMKAWEQIKHEGLKKMNRNHVHFAAGEPGEDSVISGMRTSCNVMIYIDLDLALKDGVKFFLSANNVILSPGVDGVISPCLFRKVIFRPTGEELQFQREKQVCQLEPTEVHDGIVVSADDLADELETQRKARRKKSKPEKN